MESQGDTSVITAEVIQPRITSGTILIRLLISAIAWGIHAVVTFVLWLILVKLLPIFQHDVDQWQLEIPQNSELVLVWSKYAIKYWFLGRLALILIDGPISIAVCYLPNRLVWVTWIWFVSYLLFAIFILTFVLVSVVIPYAELSNCLS